MRLDEENGIQKPLHTPGTKQTQIHAPDTFIAMKETSGILEGGLMDRSFSECAYVQEIPT